MNNMAVLFDLDGVIYQGNRLIRGAKETISCLDAHNIPYRFITNTSRMTTGKLVSKIKNFGLSVNENHIFSAPLAAIEYCRSKSISKIRLVVPDNEMIEAFKEFTITDKDPQAVIIGDMGGNFTFSLLNNIFLHLLHGAECVALHKNKFWNSGECLTLDLGAFIAALEYASGREAVIVGKPSPLLFRLASLHWKLPMNHIYMIGDDIDSDIAGGREAGMKTVLVQTGKFRKDTLDRALFPPDFVIPSVAGVPALLGV